MFQIFRNNVPPEPHACLLRREETITLRGALEKMQCEKCSELSICNGAAMEEAILEFRPRHWGLRKKEKEIA